MFSESASSIAHSKPFPYSLLGNWRLHIRQQRIVVVMGDCVASIFSFGLAAYLWTLTSPEPIAFERFTAVSIIIPLWMLIVNSLSDPRKYANRQAMASIVLTASGVSLSIYVGLFFFAPPESLPRLVALYFIALSALSTLIWRFACISFLTLRQFENRFIVVGEEKEIESVARDIAKSQLGLYKIVGVVSEKDPILVPTIAGYDVLGKSSDILELVRTRQVTGLVLGVGNEISSQLFQTLLECRAQGVEIFRMYTLCEQLTGRVPVEHLRTGWAVTTFVEATPSFFYRLFKFGFDLLAAAVGLVVFAMVLPPIALVIWLDSGSPIFYWQTRLGLNGKEFSLIKFRTMLPQAEGDGTARWAEADDPRTTRVGRFLRRTRLDEVPQFWNVFKGEMSLIGPRPERPEFIAMLERAIPFFRTRLLVKPGLTGWAQVNCGYGSSIEDAAIKLQYDLFYIKNQSFFLDLLIVWHTMRTVLQMRGT